MYWANKTTYDKTGSNQRSSLKFLVQNLIKGSTITAEFSITDNIHDFSGFLVHDVTATVVVDKVHGFAHHSDVGGLNEKGTLLHLCMRQLSSPPLIQVNETFVREFNIIGNFC